MSLSVAVWLQLAFGLAMVLPIEKDIRFGLLCTACVPGGGLGHIAVVIGDADIPLSLTMNLISVVAMLGELFTSIRLARCVGRGAASLRTELFYAASPSTPSVSVFRPGEFR